MNVANMREKTLKGSCYEHLQVNRQRAWYFMEGVFSFSPHLISLVCLEVKVQDVLDIVHLMPKIFSLSNSDSRSVSYHTEQNIWPHLTSENFMEFREYLDFALKTVVKIICRILWKSSLNLLLNNKGGLGLGLGLGFSHSLIYQQNLKNLKLVISVVVFFFFFCYAMWLACTCSDVNEVQEIPSHCYKALFSYASIQVAPVLWSQRRFVVFGWFSVARYTTILQ